MTTISVKELSGAALNWAVAKSYGLDVSIGSNDVGGREIFIVGHSEFIIFRPESNWQQGGEIIGKETICFLESEKHSNHGFGYFAYSLLSESGVGVDDPKRYLIFGKTHLEAAMRHLVWRKLGKVIDVPGELLNNVATANQHETAVNQVASDNTTNVPVAFWNSETYLPGSGMNDRPFTMSITDQRESNGQLYVDLGITEGNIDDMLSLTLEVNKLQVDGVGIEMPCLHLHFDGDNAAGSFFKQGEQYIFRPERNVEITQTRLYDDSVAYIIK